MVWSWSQDNIMMCGFMFALIFVGVSLLINTGKSCDSTNNFVVLSDANLSNQSLSQLYFEFWKGLIIGVCCGLVFTVSLVWFFVYMSQTIGSYSLDDYGCNVVARVYSRDGCIVRAETRMFQYCFTKDAIRFWYEYNCEPLVVNSTSIVVSDNEDIICSVYTNRGRIIVSGDSRRFSNCTITSVDNDSTFSWSLTRGNREPDNDTLLNLSGGFS
jgi:hypothetical protein